jgi:hypothetical protein
MVDITARFRGIVHWVEDRLVIASRRNRLYMSHDCGDSWNVLVDLPVPLVRRIGSMTRLSARLLRMGVHHVARAGDTLVIMAYGFIYTYDLISGRVNPERTKIVGSRPLALCKVGETELYYGEYRNNSERGPIHVFGTKDAGRSWHPILQLSGVRHIHGIFQDPYTNALWLTTGDNDDESAIWVSHNGLKTVERILTGSQQTRAVTLLFTEDHVYFGSDTPLEINHLYRFRRDGHGLESVHVVNGSVFYGCRTRDKLFFGTVCEPSLINKSNRAVVWSTTDGQNWTELISFKKDPWHRKLFQYGQVLFPSGPGIKNYLWITPFATYGDQISLRLSV